MTCIVGIAENDRVYIGADSAGVAGYQIRLRADRKIFRRDDFMFGFAGSFRMGQLLQYNLDLPSRAEGSDVDEFMHTQFVDAVRLTFFQGGFTQSAYGQEVANGMFLVGYQGQLFCVEPDYQIAETIDSFMAIGVGEEVALGSLYSTAEEEPEQRIKMALEAAERYTAGVRQPFFILTSEGEEQSELLAQAQPSPNCTPEMIRLQSSLRQLQWSMG